MGVYYRVAAKCNGCKNRAQLDTKYFEFFKVAEDSLRSEGCEVCKKPLEVYTSISTVDWSLLGRPVWDR